MDFGIFREQIYPLPHRTKPIHIYLIEADIWGDAIGFVNSREVGDFEWFRPQDFPSQVVPYLKNKALEN